MDNVWYENKIVSPFFLKKKRVYNSIMVSQEINIKPIPIKN
jgi:hypothetical protein